MESSVTCHCRIGCGLGLPTCLARFIRGKKRMVTAGTQTEEGMLDSMTSRRWGEIIQAKRTSTRVGAPPPPPERKPGRHSTQPTQEGKSIVGPFAPTVDELLACRKSLKPVHRKLTSCGSMPPSPPASKAHRVSKSASVPDTCSPVSVASAEVCQA